MRSKCYGSTLLAVAALLSTTFASASCTAAAPLARTGTPALFLAIPAGTAPERVSLYSMTTGRLIRNVVSDATDPQLGDGGRFVYFLRESSAGSCQSTIWKVPSTGGDAEDLRIRFGGQVMGVSRDGQLLAYTSQAGTCQIAGATSLTVVNLTTSRQHTVLLPSIVDSLAWSPDYGSVITAMEGVGERPGPTVQVVQDVWSIKHYKTGPLLPCPLAAPYCVQYDPQYDAEKDLFYISAVDPNPKRPCAVYRCSSQTYVLTELHLGKVRVLARTVGRSGQEAWLGVNTSGNSAVYTVASGGSLHTFLWTEGRSTRLEKVLLQESS
jgi:hypothetical protein